MTILGIDTSFDETSVAVVENGIIRSNIISSQVRYHKKFGGAVPFLAQRLHRERIDKVIQLALERAKVRWEDLDTLAITQGPGLAPALEVGISKAKELAETYSLPLYGINHMVGHCASCFSKKTPPLPALVVLVSGGHSELVLMKSWFNFQLLGATLDDALGEAYDKVARMLGLGYPGGPILARLAKEGNSLHYPLPVAMEKSGNLNLSYSGLKNAVRLAIETERVKNQIPLTRQQIADIAASFEYVAQRSLLLKVEKALKEYPEVKSLLLAGGVAANQELRRHLRSTAKKYKLDLYLPPTRQLCTDNAAMIALAAHFQIIAGRAPQDPATLDRRPNWRIDQE